MQIEVKVKAGQMVLVSSRYNGLVWYCAEADSDEYGDFMAHDEYGCSELINVESVDQVRG
jgi:hypothetical protein